MTNTTIIEVQFFINSQQNLGNEIIISIDVNETANYKNSNIVKICRTCKMYETIAMKHGTAIEPNTYYRGSK